MQMARKVVKPRHALPELEYPLEALSPFMSAETLRYHHGRHHAAYVTKLNTLIQGTQFENASLEDIVMRSHGPLFNNAAQAWNHAFFWRGLSPRGGGDPGGDLARKIDESFGGADALRQAFTKAALEKFGSGWTWLTLGRNGRLTVSNTNDADTPLRFGDRPLLVCDVWEHAYYIDYRNERAKYLEAFWKIVNWKFAQENLERSTAFSG